MESLVTMFHEYAFIPARGGSKGIKNKNLKKLGNFSLVRHTINFASKEFPPENIILSSDSLEILKEGEGYCTTNHRKSYLAEDNSSIRDVVVDYFQNKVTTFDPIKTLIYLLEPTSPFKKVSTLKKVMVKLRGNANYNLDIVVTAVRDNSIQFEHFDKNFDITNFPIEDFNSNRQKRPLKMREANSVFGSRLSHLLVSKNFKSNSMGLVEVDEIEAFDINIDTDLILAKAIYDQIGGIL